MSEIQPLATDADLDAALRRPVVVVYKHSPSCGASTWARAEMERFAADHADTPVVEVDVVMQRPLSRLIAERLGVRHESPQVILLRDGAVVWHAAHGDVRAALLAEQVD